MDPPPANEPHVGVDSVAERKLVVGAVCEVVAAGVGEGGHVARAIDGSEGEGLLIYCELVIEHHLVPKAGVLLGVQVAVG